VTVFQFAREIATKQTGRIAAIVALLLVATVLEMVGLTLAIPIIGSFLGASDLSGGMAQRVMDFIGLSDIEMSYLLAAFLLLMVARTALMFLSNYAIARIGVRIEREIKCALLENLLRARWTFHVDQNIGQVSNIIARESQSTSVAVRYLGRYCSSIVIATILLSASAFVAGEALLFAVFLAIPMVLLARYITFLSRQVAIARIEANNIASGQIIETGGQMKFIKSSAGEDGALERFRATVNRLAQLQLKNAVYEALIAVLPELFAAVAAVLLVVLGYYYLDRPPSDIVLFSLLVYRAFGNLGTLQNQRRALVTYIPGYEACQQMLRTAEAEAETAGHDRPKVGPLRNGIVLEDVGFEYPNSSIVVLRGVNLTIDVGDYVALVGPSGSGKTTIVDLITGLLTPVRGRVLVDGRDLAELDMRSWRRRIAYVPQDPVLFNGTIRDNILRDAGPPRGMTLKQACDLAHVTEFIGDLPDGLDTRVADRGARLSGGQRQRIAIARALMREPDLLIFDEATSALDSQSELLIRHTLNGLRGRMTIIAIAHRFSAIRDADVIFALKEGRIVESGTYEALSRAGGEFSRTLANSRKKLGKPDPRPARIDGDD
jgi:ATP-binding cassette, subfamily C, bacterial